MADTITPPRTARVSVEEMINRLERYVAEMEHRYDLFHHTGTDTLRRSLAVELCDWLLAQGAKISVFDPAVKHLPVRWAGQVTQCAAALDAVIDARALVVGTEWPEFKQAALGIAAAAKPGLVVVDANRHLQAQVVQAGLTYIAVGTTRPTGGQ